MKHIIRSRGGSKERRVLVNSIQIPDLYNVAHATGGLGTQERVAILETWHLAHDLLRAVKEVPDTQPTKE